MGTVFYGYKVEKQNLWEVIDRIREYYRRVHFIYRIKVDQNLKNLEDENVRNEFLSELQKMLYRKDFQNQVDVDLQLFDFDDHYIFQVLEAGYQFMNNGYEAITKDDRSLLEPVFYDNRADIPESDLDNEVIVDEIDKLIRQRKYFIVSIVEAGYEIYWQYWKLLSTSEGRRSMYSTNVPLSENKE